MCRLVTRCITAERARVVPAPTSHAGEGRMFDLSAPIVTMFLVYVAAMIGTGVWAYARTQTFTDSALGGRRLSAPVAALSAGVGDMSWLFLSLPGAVYAAGVRASSRCSAGAGLLRPAAHPGPLQGHPQRPCHPRGPPDRHAVGRRTERRHARRTRRDRTARHTAGRAEHRVHRPEPNPARPLDRPASENPAEESAPDVL